MCDTNDCPCGTCAAIRIDREARPEKCRPVQVDGETIRVRGEREMNEKDREMFAEVVRAVKRHLAD